MNPRYYVKKASIYLIVILGILILVDLIFLRTYVIFSFSILFMAFIGLVYDYYSIKGFLLPALVSPVLFTIIGFQQGIETRGIVFFMILYLIIILLMLILKLHRRELLQEKKLKEMDFSRKITALQQEVEDYELKIEDTDKQIDDILSIYELNRDFEKIQKLEDGLKVFEEFMRERYGIDKYFFIIKKEGEEESSFQKFSRGFQLEHSKISSINLKNLEILNTLFYMDKRLYCRNFKVKEEYHKLYVYFPAQEFLGIPIISDERNLALLILFSDQTKTFSEVLQKEMEILTPLIEAVLKKSLLFEKREKLSITDSLTKIYSRRYFNQTIEEVIQKSKDKREVFTLAIFDIDHFKSCNDNYGHRFGDYVLQEMVKIVESYLTDKDILARFGGEEFVILFPHLRKTLVYRILEEIRSAIETHEFITRRQKVSLTASFGIAQFPEDGSESKDIINAADEALYNAKASGRNRVVLFEKTKN